MKSLLLSICFMVVMLNTSFAFHNTSPPVQQSGQVFDVASQVMFDAPAVVIQAQAPLPDMVIVVSSPSQTIAAFCLLPVLVEFHPPDISIADNNSTNTISKTLNILPFDRDAYAHTQHY